MEPVNAEPCSAGNSPGVDQVTNRAVRKLSTGFGLRLPFRFDVLFQIAYSTLLALYYQLQLFLRRHITYRL